MNVLMHMFKGLITKIAIKYLQDHYCHTFSMASTNHGLHRDQVLYRALVCCLFHQPCQSCTMGAKHCVAEAKLILVSKATPTVARSDYFFTLYKHHLTINMFGTFADRQ